MTSNSIIPIFIPFSGCPIQCIYCDQNQITGVQKSITSKKVYRKVAQGLEKNRRHISEVAFYGGTFTMLPIDRQMELLQSVAPFIAEGRVASIRISTRPEKLYEADFLRLLGEGVRTIEFGVQSTDFEVLKAIKRDIEVDEMDRVVTLAKSMGFNVGLQQMTGLPNSSNKKDIETAKWISKRADFARIYPTVVFEGTELYRMYLQGLYKPQSLDEAIHLAATLLDLYESEAVPVIRVGLDHMKREDFVDGPYDDNFREYAESHRLVQKICHRYERIQCIHASSKALRLSWGLVLKISSICPWPIKE